MIDEEISGSRRAVLARVTRLLAEHIEPDPQARPFTEDAKLWGRGLGLDSLDVLTLAGALEEEFGLTLDDSELSPRDLETVASLVDFVTRRVAP